MNNIKFTVKADVEEYEVELYGSFQTKGFSGKGSGYFGISQVIEFCQKAEKIAETMDEKAELAGLTRRSDGSIFLETFVIRVYPLSTSKLNGVVGIHITLGEYPSSDCREEEKLKVSGEIQTRNQHLLQFSKDIRALLSGSVKEVILDKGVDII
ncbi:hypothetical protein [Pleionea litopenaei]|uniref:Uncharacterized protein n=1 Tax=Pleionea litopenaei TaxID=3070815 RepID=A0AA51RR70_9GAMM|nr:hypothetical protein [Pleionea sp. HL-JVS1]WMS86038.1 hypothetical protein Q9312_12500 [Pleionea sp. HL-JVS1]